MSYAIETVSLTKVFPVPRGWRALLMRKETAGRAPAVNEVNLRVQEGELFGLLGPNGAGKTTLIKLLSTLIVPTSGSAKVNGWDLSQETAVKRSIGLATGDERSFYWRLSGRQNLKFFGSLYGLADAAIEQRVETVLAQVDLQSVGDKRFQTYSTGMRQRLAIARALLSEPRLLFLDEPTRGLDPTAVRQVQDLIRDLCEHGITIFLTTHNLFEAAGLCQRLAILHHGRVQACGSVNELRQVLSHGERYQIRVSSLPAGAEARLLQLPGFSAQPDTEMEFGRHTGLTQIQFESRNGDHALQTALNVLHESSAEVKSIDRIPASLEAIFTYFTEEGVGERGEERDGERGRGREGEYKTEEGAAAVPRLSTEENVHTKAQSETKNTPKTGHRQLSGWRVALAFLKRDFINETSYRVSFLLQGFGIFFSISVFYFMARLLDQAAAPHIAAYGGNYFAFVLIGIAFAEYFGLGLSGFASTLRQAQTTGTLEAMLATPTGLSTIIISSALWDYAWTTLRVLVYLGMGVLFLGVDLAQGNYAAALLVLALTIIVFSSLGILAASFIVVLKRGDPVTWIFSAVSNLLGGVYYPINVLPVWLQALSALLPVTYALRAMRLALLQGASISELRVELLVLTAFAMLLLPLSLKAFQFAVKRARVEGTLGHY